MKIFKVVYEERSINKASQKIFMSSQGVGKVIQKLESELETEIKIEELFCSEEIIDYQDLNGETVVLVGRQFHPYHNNRNRFARAGVRPKEMIEISEIAYTHIFAANNEGIGISVDFVAQQHANINTVILPFADETCRWDTYLVYPGKEPPREEIKQFLEFSLEYRDTMGTEYF